MERIKSYFIIGASSDVGCAFLRSLEEKLSWTDSSAGNQGMTTVSVIAHFGTNRAVLDALSQECPHLQLIPIGCDLGSRAEVERLLDEAAAYGTPDCILYLAAGKLEYQKLKKLDYDKMDRDMEIQVHALARVGARFLPEMAKNRFGKLVVMLSECTLGMPPRFMTGYVMVKYAALGLMKSMAMEYADKNVNVNGLSPAMMETKFLSQIDPRLIEMNMENNVKKRNATPEEIAEAIHFLTSKGSDYMNGVNLNVSGGNR